MNLRTTMAMLNRTLLACAMWGCCAAFAAEDAYDKTSLDGNFRAQDVFVLRDSSGDTANGLRTFDGAGRLSSLVSFASRTPLDYAVSGDGFLSWSTTGYAPGKVGSLGLGNTFAVYAPTLAANADAQVSLGYAALRMAILDATGYSASDLKGDYSYHALLFKGSKWWNVFGAAASDGKGNLFLLRSGAATFTQACTIADDGAVAIGAGQGKAATLFADGDLMIQTPQVAVGVDALYTTGYDGLAEYVRRGTTAAPFTASKFFGSYNIIELRVKPNGASATRTGRITAGTGGQFIGTLGGAAFNGTASFFNTGVFTLNNASDAEATMGAGGDFAVVTKKSGLVNGGSGEAWMQIWLRTAGGAATPRDADGDGVADATETSQGSNPAKRDTDGDGLLDNVDVHPLVADNTFTAVLSDDNLTVVEGDPDPDPVALTLDAKDYPFFSWSIASDAEWAHVSDSSGAGHAVLSVSLDTSTLAARAQAYEAHLTITAPGMATVAPLTISVKVKADAIGLAVLPGALQFTMAENGVLPAAQVLHVSASATSTFNWTAEASENWLKVLPASGTKTGDVTVSILANSLLPSDAPHVATVDVTSGTETTSATVSLKVYPRRGLNEPFPIDTAGLSTLRPAIALSNSATLVAYSDTANVYAVPLDARAVPLTVALQLDGPLGVITGGCAAAINPGAGRGLVVWEETTSDTAPTYISAREITVATGALDNGFVMTGSNSPTEPALLFDAGRATYVFACVTHALERRQVQLTFFTEAQVHDAVLSTVYEAPVDVDITDPALALDPATGAVLVAWREASLNNSSLNQGRIAARVVQHDGQMATETTALSDSALLVGAPAVAFDSVRPAWLASWREAAASQSAHTRYKSLPLDLAQLAENTLEPNVALPVITDDGAALTFSSTGHRALAAFGCEDDRLRVATVTPAAYVVAGPSLVPGAVTQSLPNAATSPDGAVHWITYLEAGKVMAMRLEPGNPDGDGDGLDDDWEIRYGLDPNSGLGDDGDAGDPDGDGASNLDEQRMGTDPRARDTDSDGLNDAQEDLDRDGVLDTGESRATNADTDGDGAGDATERFLGSNPASAASLPASGIAWIEYGAFLPGEATTLRLHVYAATAGTYSLALNPIDAITWVAPAGWTAVPKGETSLSLPVGQVVFEIEFTPEAALTPATDHATCRFVLSGPGTNKERTAVLVCDARTNSGLSAADERALVEKYAPVFRMHEDDVFLPAPVQLSFNLATELADASTTLAANLGAIAAGQQPQADAMLDLPGTTIEALTAAYQTAAPAYPAEIYYTVCDLAGPTSAVPAPTEGRVLQFYLHYLADNWGARQPKGYRHEGDWEVMQITFDGTGAPQLVTVGQQLELARAGLAPGASTAAWNELEKVAGDRPVLYCGNGSHALYYAAGATAYGAALDAHNGLGAWMLPRTGAEQAVSTLAWKDEVPYALTRLPRLYEAAAPGWLKFAGTWGQRNFPQGSDDTPVSGAADGAPGPLFIGTPSVWTDPYAWQQASPRAVLNAMTKAHGRFDGAGLGKGVAAFDARGQVFRAPLDETGAYMLSLPVGIYWLALATTDATGREMFLNSARATTGEGSLPYFVALDVDTNEWGTLALDGTIYRGAANYPKLDLDGDGVFDDADTDLDNDGLVRSSDADTLNDGWKDSFQFSDLDNDGVPAVMDDDDDGDGTPDAQDSDHDGNGVPDANEMRDTDGDGVPDPYDLDIDNDGYSNAAERAAGTDAYLRYDSPARHTCDANGDGEVNSADAQLIINAALGRSAYTVWMDPNEDGHVLAIDIGRCIQIILKMRQQ